MLSRIHVFADSSPSAMTDSVTFGDPDWYSSQDAAVPPASTIMMATSPSSSCRPATTSSNADESPS